MIHTIKKFAGLYTHPSPLSQVPEGALTVADEVTIDREGVLENRRGFNFYGEGVFSSTIKSALEFKNRLLVHEGSNLSFDSDGAGSFTTYSGSISEPESGIKIRGVELNGSLFFTSSTGIMKTDALTTAPTLAGVPKALDASASYAAGVNGFMPANSQLAYRIVWGKKDANNVVTLGYPSSRTEISNSLVTITSLTSSSSTATATCSSPHGLTTGDIVTISNTEAYKSATGAFASPIVTITSNAHGYSNGDSITIKGFEQDEANGTFIVSNVTANTFDYTVSATLPATLTGNGKVGKDVDAYDGIYTATVTSTTEFTYQIVGTPHTTANAVDDLEMVVGKDRDISLTFPIPNDITTSHFYRIYRSAPSADENTTASDRLQLVYESSPTSAEITAKELTVTDLVPDDFRGADLYTNATQEGISQGNDIPPFAKDIAAFKNSLFYANTKTRHALDLHMLSVDGLQRDVSTVTIAGTTYKFSTLEDHTLTPPKFKLYADISGTITSAAGTATFTTAAAEPHGYSTNDVVSISGADQDEYNDDFTITVTSATTFTFAVSGAPASPGTGTIKASTGTPAQNLADTVKSLIKIINKTAANTAVYAYYTSGSTDVPGKFRLEGRSLATSQFAVTCSADSVGDNFSPILPTAGTTVQSANDTVTNRVYYSKTNQPDSVPALNYFDVGSRDKVILRIMSLRDSLFVIKQDGIFRVSGEDPKSFSQSLFDSNVICLAGETVARLNNSVYMYSDQGVVSVSEAGVAVVSRPIEIDLVEIASFSGFAARMHAVGYESERKYVLWAPETSTDTTPTISYTYNTFTSAWTRWKKPAHCAIVIRGSGETDKLYLGNTYTDTILKERKTSSRNDYKDEAVSSTLSNVDNSAQTATLTYSYGSFGIRVGMLVEQGVKIAKIVDVSGTTITLDRNANFVNGACTVSKPIEMLATLVPFDNKSPGTMKLFREFQAYPLTDTFTLSNAIFASDLNAQSESVEFSYPNRGLGWGGTAWGESLWGDETNIYGATPVRTYIPKTKARCRALTVGFDHSVANERVSILNVTLVFEQQSERTSR